MRKLTIVLLFLLFSLHTIIATALPLETTRKVLSDYIKYTGYCVSCKQKVILTNVRYKEDLSRKEVYFLGNCIHCCTPCIISSKDIPEIELKILELKELRATYEQIKGEYEIERGHWFKFFWIKL